MRGCIFCAHIHNIMTAGASMTVRPLRQQSLAVKGAEWCLIRTIRIGRVSKGEPREPSMKPGGPAYARLQSL